MPCSKHTYTSQAAVKNQSRNVTVIELMKRRFFTFLRKPVFTNTVYVLFFQQQAVAADFSNALWMQS